MGRPYGPGAGIYDICLRPYHRWHNVAIMLIERQGGLFSKSTNSAFLLTFTPQINAPNPDLSAGNRRRPQKTPRKPGSNIFAM